MKFGIHTDRTGPEKLVDLAVSVDRLGYDGIFRLDHIWRETTIDPWISLCLQEKPRVSVWEQYLVLLKNR